MAVALVAGVFSVVAITTTATVAGASTTPVNATWSGSGPVTTGFVTATPPAGTVSATVTLSGAGGGGGGTDSNTSNGGAGGQVTGTFALTHNTGQVAVELGGGGGAGNSCSSDFSACTASASSGGSGYEAGGGGGQSSSETASVQGAASGGGGGAASGLYLGSSSSGTLVAVAGGGGGGGGEWGCDGDQTNGGAGGAGDTGGSGASSAGATGGTSGDSEGGGSGGAAGGAPGAGATSSSHNGGNEGTSTAGGDGGGAGPSTGQGGQDHCTTGEDASGGGGGGGSVASSSYDTSVTYNSSGGGGGSSQKAGTAGSITLVWNVATVSITTPSAQTSTSGTAISNLAISATDSASLGLTYTASGLPPGLSINSSTGVISGTPTTGSATPYSVTVTATDTQAATASTSAFNWTVNNTVTVTNPGPFTNNSGTAISTVNMSATTSGSAGGATISSTGWSVTSGSLPTGLSLSTAGAITGTPTTAGSYSATIQATDSAGFHGSTTVAWTIDNVVTVTAPSAQTSNAGTAIANVTVTASDSSSTATITGWSLSGAPPGLSINSSGVISGTPTTGGSYSVTATATDSKGFTGTSSAFSWTVHDVVTVTNPGNQSNVSGSAITGFTPSASVAGGGTISSWAQSGLPAGLSFNTSTGAISGTPTTACSCSVTLTATDSRGAQGSATFTWTISNHVAVTNPGTQSNVSGTAITALQISATDTQSGATLTYSATGLPAGLTISSSGSITGTPTTACACSVTVTATDGPGYQGSTTFTWNITNHVAVTNPGAQSNVSGSAITALQISATDSQSGATLTYSATGLPAGLTISSSGSITGTPTTACACSVTVKAQDAAGYSGTATFGWNVTNTVSVTSPGAQTNVSGTAITSLDISASDSSSTAALAYADNGTLPPGLTVNALNGDITGTPTTGGVYPVTITVTDNAGYSNATTFNWTITNTVSVTSPGDQSSVSGSPITAVPVSATDSSSTATLSYSDNGTLPPGLSIDPTSGSITGTPTTKGTYPVTITVTDSAGYTGTASFNWVITNTISVTNPGAQSNVSGSPITAVPISATDSSPTATLAYSDGGTLPPGLSIDPTSGSITGTPTTGGTYTVTITVTDDSDASASVTFTWTITNAVSVTNPGAQSNVSGAAITAVPISATDSSSTATLAYSDGGTLPPGLSIDPTSGSITGTPTTAGSYPVTITATDNAGYSGNTNFTWTITNTVSVTSPGAQTDGSGAAITAVPISATDSSSTATLTYSDGGTLPPGLSIDPTSGSITGTPTTGGTYTVTITATDDAGYSGTATFTWTIGNTVSVTSPGDQTDGSGTAITAVPVSATDSSAGATLTYSDGGTLPPGLSIDPTSGSITGTPTTGGVYAVTITATDGSGASGNATFNWTITNTVSVTSPGDQSDGSGTAITAVPITATDSSSTATLSYSDNGTLPPGLSIDPTSGSITGTPTTAGVYAVTITVTDNAGFSGTASFNWTIGNTVSVTSPGDQSDGSGTAITAVPITATDSSSSATLTYSDGGTLPPGLSIDPTSGSITGTPTTGGVYAVTITATDGSGASGNATFNWTITNTVSVTSPGDQSDVSGAAITAVAVSATDSSAGATLTYSDGGTLPPGLSIDPTSGSITGTPTTGGTYPVTITATDNAGYSGNATFTWTITNTVTVAPISQQSSATGVEITPLVPTATDSQTTPAPVFTWTATNLPPGLTIGRAGGHIVGKPTTDGIYSVTVSATDNANPTNTGSTSFEWSVFTIAPVITKVKPATGPGAGGTKVAIIGTNLAHASSVSFGSVNAPGFKVNKKGTKITVRAPAQAAGTVDIIVTTPAGGASSPTAADHFTYNGPSVLSVSPATGSTAGGTTVTIHGKGLAGATSVAFGSDDAVNPTVNKTGTVITATAPAEAAGQVNIVVTNEGGESAVVPADQFTYVGPTVTAVAPATGPPAGGNKVTITGAELGGATSVTFGGTQASIVSVNAKGTKVVVTAPGGSGTVDVIVTTPGGSSASVPADQYTYS